MKIKRDISKILRKKVGTVIKEKWILQLYVVGKTIKAAAALPGIIRTVVTLSTQSYGAVESVSQLGKGCSIILIHGTDDVLSPICSSLAPRMPCSGLKITLSSTPGAFFSRSIVAFRSRSWPV